MFKVRFQLVAPFFKPSLEVFDRVQVRGVRWPGEDEYTHFFKPLLNNFGRIDRGIILHKYKAGFDDSR